MTHYQLCCQDPPVLWLLLALGLAAQVGAQRQRSRQPRRAQEEYDGEYNYDDYAEDDYGPAYGRRWQT